MKNRIMIWIVIMTLIVPTALSFGVRPAQTTIIHDPSLERTISITLVNIQKQETMLELKVSPELKQIVTPNEINVTLSPNEEQTKVYFKILKTPLEPGNYTGKITAKQSLADKEGINAAVQLEHKITIISPENSKETKEENKTIEKIRKKLTQKTLLLTIYILVLVAIFLTILQILSKKKKKKKS